MDKTIANLKKLKSFHNGSYGADIDKAIKALEQEPTPMEKWEARHNMRRDEFPIVEKYAQDKVISVLNKIKEEIIQLSPEPTVEDVVSRNPTKDAIRETLYEVLMIIDKHKESEE